jgi:hypothetical protein
MRNTSASTFKGQELTRKPRASVDKRRLHERLVRPDAPVSFFSRIVSLGEHKISRDLIVYKASASLIGVFERPFSSPPYRLIGSRFPHLVGDISSDELHAGLWLLLFANRFFAFRNHFADIHEVSAGKDGVALRLPFS